MNTTITPDPLALVLPALEVWGARVTGYLSVMGMVIMHYDCLLTLKDEVRLIFSHCGIRPTLFLSRCASCGQEASLSQNSSTTLIDISLALL